MKLSAIVNKPAYTDKGNQYNKFSGGKKIGAVLLAGAAITRDVAVGAFNKQDLRTGANLFGSKSKYIACAALFYAAVAAVGAGIGAIADAVVNKARKTKADTEMTETTPKTIEDDTQEEAPIVEESALEIIEDDTQEEA